MSVLMWFIFQFEDLIIFKTCFVLSVTMSQNMTQKYRNLFVSKQSRPLLNEVSLFRSLSLIKLESECASHFIGPR